MTTILAVLGVIIAWAGASAVALSRDEAGHAAGIAVAAAGAALVALLHDGAAPAGVILAGAIAASVLLGAGSTRRFQLAPVGSAPIVTLCVVMGALAAWLGATLLSGPQGAAGRVAALALLGIGVSRMLNPASAAGARAAAVLVALGAALAVAPAGASLAAVAVGAAAVTAASGRLQAS